MDEKQRRGMMAARRESTTIEYRTDTIGNTAEMRFTGGRTIRIIECHGEFLVEALYSTGPYHLVSMSDDEARAIAYAILKLDGMATGKG